MILQLEKLKLLIFELYLELLALLFRDGLFVKHSNFDFLNLLIQIFHIFSELILLELLVDLFLLQLSYFSFFLLARFGRAFEFLLFGTGAKLFCESNQTLAYLEKHTRLTADGAVFLLLSIFIRDTGLNTFLYIRALFQNLVALFFYRCIKVLIPKIYFVKLRFELHILSASVLEQLLILFRAFHDLLFVFWVENFDLLVRFLQGVSEHDVSGFAKHAKTIFLAFDELTLVEIPIDLPLHTVSSSFAVLPFALVLLAASVELSTEANGLALFVLSVELITVFESVHNIAMHFTFDKLALVRVLLKRPLGPRHLTLAMSQIFLPETLINRAILVIPVVLSVS